MKGYSKDHHAHIVSLDGADALSVLDMLENAIKEVHRDEEVRAFRMLYDPFEVAEARSVLDTTGNRNQKNERRIFFIGITSGTRDAQNMLLKTLEEPAVGTSFVLLVPSSDILLETIRSRCILISLEEGADTDSNFLAKPYKERLEYVQELLDDRSLLSGFFKTLEREVSEYVRTHGSSGADGVSLKLPSEYKHFILNRHSGSKYFLEEMALRLPLITKP